jgi:exodeoxyribonuclease VII large subunit
VYFTIKDKAANGVMDCIMWGRNYEMCGVALEVGMEIILSGHANVYAPSGRLSFVADTVELVGEGALKKAYDDLRKKLETEGMFAEERKRALPDYVSRIGVITSMKGAVIHDFENNLGKFGFVVNVIDSRVEGQQSVAPLLAALAKMRALTVAGGASEREAIEALVIIRGGGSLESLQAFNNETLVREVVNFPVPVIAGIGHDQDVPLMALAADYMTSTPTAAAHLLSRSWEEARIKLEQFSRIHVRIEQEIRRIRIDLEVAWSSMIDHTEKQLSRIKERLAFAEQSVRLNDPTRQLKLGYSIVRRNGKIVRSVSGVKIGDELYSQFSDGEIQSRVEKI